MKIALLPGDGIGPEIVAETVKVLKGLGEKFEFEGSAHRRRRLRSERPSTPRGVTRAREASGRGARGGDGRLEV
jgi:hypothetical protein